MPPESENVEYMTENSHDTWLTPFLGSSKPEIMGNYITDQSLEVASIEIIDSEKSIEHTTGLQVDLLKDKGILRIKQYPDIETGGSHLALNLKLNNIQVSVVEADNDSTGGVIHITLCEDIQPKVFVDDKISAINKPQAISNIRVWCTIPFSTLHSESKILITLSESSLDQVAAKESMRYIIHYEADAAKNLEHNDTSKGQKEANLIEYSDVAANTTLQVVAGDQIHETLLIECVEEDPLMLSIEYNADKAMNGNIGDFDSIKSLDGVCELDEIVSPNMDCSHTPLTASSVDLATIQLEGLTLESISENFSDSIVTVVEHDLVDLAAAMTKKIPLSPESSISKFAGRGRRDNRERNRGVATINMQHGNFNSEVFASREQQSHRSSSFQSNNRQNGSHRGRKGFGGRGYQANSITGHNQAMMDIRQQQARVSTDEFWIQKNKSSRWRDPRLDVSIGPRKPHLYPETSDGRSGQRTFLTNSTIRTEDPPSGTQPVNSHSTLEPAPLSILTVTHELVNNPRLAAGSQKKLRRGGAHFGCG